ncbi:MAG: VOC family protein [Deltaproteobacteria bacterium]|nr:MAG: VOC family protein [Deltaproteobacteria bacterium]
MLSAIDHVVVAVHDLPRAAARYAALLGRAPSWQGEHPALGTANCLFRLDNSYLELLAARAGDVPAGSVGRRIREAPEGVFALAFATADAAALAADLRARGVAASEPVDGEGRESARGARRQWRSVFLPERATRGLRLFAIEHRSPAEALPPAGHAAEPEAEVTGLDHVVVASPDVEASAALYGARLGLRLALDRSDAERGLRLLFFRIGGVTLEVVGRLDAPPDASAPDRFFGLAYRVANADAARRRLVAAGFDVSPVRAGRKPGTRVCTVRRDTCGVPTLVIEPRAQERASFEA